MTNKTTPILLVIAALAFGGAAVNGTFDTVSANQAAAVAENRSALDTEIQDKYDVKLSDAQLDEIACTDGAFGDSCYEGPTDEIQYYGTTQYEKADGSATVTIQLISAPGGVGIMEVNE